MSDPVIQLSRYREVRRLEDLDYSARVMAMDKLELLDEMVRYQEERSAVGELTLPMMVRGRILFGELEKSAETRELQILTSSYRRHLEYELREYLNREA